MPSLASHGRLRVTPARPSMVGRSAARMHVKCVRENSASPLAVLDIGPFRMAGHEIPVVFAGFSGLSHRGAQFNTAVCAPQPGINYVGWVKPIIIRWKQT